MESASTRSCTGSDNVCCLWRFAISVVMYIDFEEISGSVFEQNMPHRSFEFSAAGSTLAEGMYSVNRSIIRLLLVLWAAQ